MTHIRIALAVLPLLAVTACTPMDMSFGDAVKTDYSLQVANPDARPTRPDIKEGGSGEQAAAAAERYRKGTVKQPQSIQTTSGSSSAGGGGAASSSSGTK